MRNFLANVIATIQSAFAQIGDGFRMVLEDGRWVLMRVKATAMPVINAAAGPAGVVWERVIVPAAKVAAGAVTLPIRFVGAAFSHGPSESATASVEQAALSKAAQAEANFERARRPAAVVKPVLTVSECAHAQALSILDGTESPDTGHLSLAERAWVWSIDTRVKAAGVHSTLIEDIERHLSGEITILRLPCVPTSKQVAQIQRAYDAEIDHSLIDHRWTTSLTDAQIEEMRAAVGPGPR